MKTTFALRASVAAVALVAASASHAQLTIPFAWTESNSVQAFPAEIIGAFDLVRLTVTAAGNAKAKGTQSVGELNGTLNYSAFNFPITKIVIGSKLNIASGSADGSALVFERQADDDFDGVVEGVYGFTLANFTINYDTSMVLADVTPKGGTTSKQRPLYLFNKATPLALKYKFPLTVTGHEVLNQLQLAPEAKELFTNVLVLPEIALGALELDYGTLTQDISTNLRKVKISSTPYTAK